MIVKDHGFPPGLCAKLTEILGNWAVYRTRELANGRIHPPERWSLMRREATQPLELVARWEIHQLPGCQWVGVSAKVNVEVGWRGRGLGHLTLSMRAAIAKGLGYQALLAAVRESNIPETRTLIRARWHSVSRFMNPKGDWISLWFKSL